MMNVEPQKLVLLVRAGLLLLAHYVNGDGGLVLHALLSLCLGLLHNLTRHEVLLHNAPQR